MKQKKENIYETSCMAQHCLLMFCDMEMGLVYFQKIKNLINIIFLTQIRR